MLYAYTLVHVIIMVVNGIFLISCHNNITITRGFGPISLLHAPSNGQIILSIFWEYHPVLKCFCGNADPCHCSPWKGKGLKKEPHQTLKSAGYISVVACLFEHWQLDDVVPKASASMSGAFVKQQELNLHLSGQSQVCDPISRNTGIKFQLEYAMVAPNPALKNVKIHVSSRV